jgi:O-antigen/teichoic acid export membrane protein
MIGSKLISGSLTRVINTISTALVSLLIIPFVVHALGDRMYGIWTLVATFSGYYGLVELGLSQAITRHLGHSLGSLDSEECNRVFNTSLRIYLALGGVALLVTAALAAIAPLFCKSAEDASLFWKVILVLGVSLALQFPMKVYKGVLEAHLRFDLTAGLDLLTLVIRTVFVVAIIFLGYKIVGLAWVTLLTGIPSMALSVYYTHKELPFLRVDSKYWGMETARTLFSYSAFSFIAHVAYIVRFRIDFLVVAAFLGLTAVTHYSIADKLMQYFIEFLTALFGVLPSVFSRLEGAQDFEGIKRTFFFGTKLSLSITSFFTFGFVAWGKPFITRWMGPSYGDAYPVLVVLAVGLTFFLWQTVSISLLYGTSRHKVLAIFNVIEAVANLALSLVLVRRYGIIGVAFGTTVPITINTLLLIPAYVCRISKIDYFEYLRKVARTLLVASASMVLPAVLSLKFSAPDYKSMFIVGTLSMILYALPMWLFEFTSTETRELLRAI